MNNEKYDALNISLHEHHCTFYKRFLFKHVSVLYSISNKSFSYLKDNFVISLIVKVLVLEHFFHAEISMLTKHTSKSICMFKQSFMHVCYKKCNFVLLPSIRTIFYDHKHFEDKN